MVQMLLEVNGNVFLHQVKKKPSVPWPWSYFFLLLLLSSLPLSLPLLPAQRSLWTSSSANRADIWVRTSDSDLSQEQREREVTNTHLHKCMRTHAHSCKRTQKQGAMHAHTYSHTYTHTQTLATILPISHSLSFSFLSFTSLLPPTWQQTSCWVKALSL